MAYKISQYRYLPLVARLSFGNVTYSWYRPSAPLGYSRCRPYRCSGQLREPHLCKFNQLVAKDVKAERREGQPREHDQTTASKRGVFTGNYALCASHVNTDAHSQCTNVPVNSD